MQSQWHSDVLLFLLEEKHKLKSLSPAAVGVWAFTQPQPRWSMAWEPGLLLSVERVILLLADEVDAGLSFP